MIDNNSFFNVDLNQVSSCYHRIKIDKNQQIKIIKPWYGWLVTALFGWNTKLDSALTAQLFNFIQDELRHSTAEQREFITRLGRNESSELVISVAAQEKLSHLVNIFTQLGRKKKEQYIGRNDFNQKFIISSEDINQIQKFIDDAIVTPKRALLIFNRIEDVARSLIVKGKLVENDNESAQKAMELVYLLNKFEEVARNKNNIIHGAAEMEDADIEFPILKSDILQLKNTILQALQRGEIPSFDWITTAIHFDGKISKDEKTFIQFCQTKLPNLNKALIGYELLQRKTESIQKLQNPQSYIELEGEVFSCFDVTQWDSPMLVHSIGLNDWGKTKFNLLTQQRYEGNLCTSLIDETAPFFEEDSSVALVLAVNPQTIIATNSHDIRSPGIQPNQDNHYVDMGVDFHNMYNKLRILTGYISRIYLASQPDSHASGEDYSRYLRLDCLIDDYLTQLRKGDNPLDLHSIEKIRKECEGGRQEQLLNEFPNQPLVKEIVELSNEIMILKGKNVDQTIFNKNYDRERGVPFFQLEHLIRHYKENPETDPQEYYKLFGRRGEGIIEELEKMLSFLIDLQADSNFFRFYFNQILSPREILAQTTRAKGHDAFPWNEISLDLRREQGEMQGAQVRALLINRKVLEGRDFKEIQHLQKLLREAKVLNLPILIRNSS